jgi:hypothetical protein
MSTHLGRTKPIHDPSEASKLSKLLRERGESSRERLFYVEVRDHGYLEKRIQEERVEISKKEAYIHWLTAAHHRAPSNIALLDDRLLYLDEQILLERQKLASKNLHKPRGLAKPKEETKTHRIWRSLLEQAVAAGCPRETFINNLPEPH